MTDRMISLASGVLPEFSPTETAGAAAAAGWPAVGIWVDPKTWTGAVAAEVRSRTSDAGLTVLDVEVIWLQPGADDPDHLRIIDAGLAIGAHNVLVVSSDPDHASTAAKLARLIDHASGSINVALEFASFTKVGSIADALAILDKSDRDDARLLIDALHFTRTGGKLSDLDTMPVNRLSYAQLCDATATGPASTDVPAIIEEALDRRLPLGDGALPLAAMLAAMPPDLPLSIELRSKALREAYPDALERAAAVLTSTRSGMARMGSR